MDFKKKLIAEYDRETANTRTRCLRRFPQTLTSTTNPTKSLWHLGRLLGHLSRNLWRLGHTHPDDG